MAWSGDCSNVLNFRLSTSCRGCRAKRIRLAAAVKLYEMGQLSSGAAAQLAGVPKPYFLGHLADYGVNTFDLSEEELIHDLKSA